MKLFRSIYFVAFILFSGNAYSGWNGVGEIQTMFIYPDYAVIVQGDAGPGPASCTDNSSWSFAWSDFDAQVQARIQSMLLTAYASKTPIQVFVYDSVCGPEGNKKFTGQFMFP
jgi:hypothetical protein